MDGERGEDGVEGVWFEGEGFEVGNDLPVDGEVFDVVEGEVCVAVKECVRGIDAGEFGDSR